MTARWIVDTDGRGGYAVAAEEGGGSRRVSEPTTLAKAEKLKAKLKARDEARAQAAKVESGRRLAAANRQAKDSE